MIASSPPPTRPSGLRPIGGGFQITAVGVTLCIIPDAILTYILSLSSENVSLIVQ